MSGETRISRSTSPIVRLELEPKRVKPLSETLEAIEKADLITLGPGSLFTSVIPNLLVDGIPQAMAASRAVKVYFVNLMSQPGETTGFRASDHLAAVLDHCGRSAKVRRNLIDVCVINTRPIGGKVLERYHAKAARPVENDIANLEAMGVRILGEDLLRLAGRRPQDGSSYKIRHDSAALGAVAVELAREARYEKSGNEKKPREKRKLAS